jgi:protein-S-isoprenylcysteine O-methyltransferase Ste14
MNHGKAFLGIVKTLGSAVVLSLLLFLSAGRLNWTMGWAYVGLSLIGTVVSILIVDMDLLAERAQVGQGARTLDVILAVIMARVGPAVIALVAGLNVRFGWKPHILPGVQGAGIFMIILGYVVTLWAMASNKFFSGVVRIQKERGHTVVTGGPYAIIRHPGYFGAILGTVTVPLMLGSVWALIPALVTAGVIVVRTALEDQTLLRDLPGYSTYAGNVQYRLLPGVW